MKDFAISILNPRDEASIIRILEEFRREKKIKFKKIVEGEIDFQIPEMTIEEINHFIDSTEDEEGTPYEGLRAIIGL